MKKIDLNIELSEDVMDEDGKTKLKGYEVAIRWISIMIERALNEPDPKTQRPTVAVNMDVQRKYFKVMDVVDRHKDGIVELEDDDFSFLDRKFHQAKISVQREINKILVNIENAMNKAKVVEKK